MGWREVHASVSDISGVVFQPTIGARLVPSSSARIRCRVWFVREDCAIW